MLKRLFTYFVLAVGVLQSTGANATDLDSAFNSLVGNGMVTGSGPSMQSTATRQVFVAGGIEARFPRSKGTVSLLSITPPTMPSAGCGGISAHFGGFSFVSGAQIEQLIKNIGQNSVGMVVSVVIKTLCPICDAVIQAMTKLAQDAAKLAIDSCAVATNISEMVETAAKSSGIMGSNPSLTTTVCGKKVTVSGGSEDYLSAVQGVDAVCGSLSSAMESVGSAIRRAEGKSAKPGESAGEVTAADREAAETLKLNNAWGNTTWNALNAIFGVIKQPTTKEQTEDLRNRMLLMNVLGTEIISDQGKPGVTLFPYDGLNATLSGKQLFELFMCGAPGSYTSTGQSGATLALRNTRQYCKYFYGSPKDKDIGELGQDGGYNWWVYQCPEKDPNGNLNSESCAYVEKVALKSSVMLRGVGFLPQTEMLLQQAVEAVRTNKEGGFDPRFLALANSVNFPIYQAINAAAVYPASTDDLLSTMSVLVAESLVYAKLEEVVRPQGKSADRMTIHRDMALRVYDALESMNKMHLSQKESYGRMMTVQEGAVHSIRQINLAIQKQVMTPELLGNNKMSAAMANSVTETK